MSRTTLKPIVSNLREEIVKGISGKFEKYGFDKEGKIIIDKPLSEYDELIKSNMLALFEARNINSSEKFIEYIHDTARTFLHILICFKLMEKRGIMRTLLAAIIGTDIYNEIIPDFTSVAPIAFDEFANKYSEAIEILANRDNDDEELEYYQFIYLMEKLTKEMAKEVPLLFKEYEYNLIQPDYDDMRVILHEVSTIGDEEYEEDDFLGWIYQYWVDTEANDIEVAKENRDISYANFIFSKVLELLDLEQTEFGEFYTPRWVVKYIVDNSINYYKGNNNIPVEKIKILDPACGAGNFLVYALDAIIELYKNEHPDWTIKNIVTSALENNIYGADIQREPLQITALNLWIKAKSYAVKARIDELNLFNVNVLMANSLYPWETEEEFHQMSIFDTPETISEKKFTSEDIGRLISSRNAINHNNAVRFFKQKFDIVVMNPPFVDTRNMPQETKDFIKKYYPKNSRNFVAAFIERVINITTDNGFIGFIASDTFKTLVSYKYLRKMLLDNVSIRKMIELGYGVFEADVSCGMYFLDKKYLKRNEITYIDARKINKKAYKVLEEISGRVGVTIKQKIFYEYPDYVFLTDLPQYLRELYAEKKCLGLGNPLIAECRVGIKIGDNEDNFVKKKWYIPSQLLEQKKFVLISKTNGESYIRDYQDVVLWDGDGSGIKDNPGCLWQNSEFYFRGGLSYNLGGRIFKVRKLPDNVLFTQGSSGIFFTNEYKKYEDYFLGILKTKLVNYFLLQINPTNNTTPNDVKKIPMIIGTASQVDKIEKLSLSIQKAIINRKEYDILSDYFKKNAMLDFWIGEVKSTCQRYIDFIEYSMVEEYEYKLELEEEVYSLFKISDDERERIEDELGSYYKVVGKLEVETLKKIKEYYLNGKKSDTGRQLSPMNIIEISEELNISPRDVYDSLRNMNVSKIASYRKCIIDFIRYLIIKIINERPCRIYQTDELSNLIIKEIENYFDSSKDVVEEIESIMGASIKELLINGVRNEGVKYDVICPAMPLISEKILGGKGKTKEKVYWLTEQFLVEYEEDKRYSMQNEIRRLTDEVYLFKLQRVKEKMQDISLSDFDMKKLEKDLIILEECVKTLENWKVVD